MQILTIYSSFMSSPLRETKFIPSISNAQDFPTVACSLPEGQGKLLKLAVLEKMSYA
jgi:hypothetical protein